MRLAKIILLLVLCFSVATNTSLHAGGFWQTAKMIAGRIAGAGTAVTIAATSVAGTLTRVPGEGWVPGWDTAIPCVQSSASSSSGPNDKGDQATATSQATTAMWPICTHSGDRV